VGIRNSTAKDENKPKGITFRANSDKKLIYPRRYIFLSFLSFLSLQIIFVNKPEAEELHHAGDGRARYPREIRLAHRQDQPVHLAPGSLPGPGTQALGRAEPGELTDRCGPGHVEINNLPTLDISHD
jgi:hypothetical protein